MSAFAGDLENTPIELPPGTYYVKAVNEYGDTFPFNEMEIGPGESFRVSPFSASFTSLDIAHAIQVTARFLIDVEVARLGVMESMSGGYTTDLFDPEVEPTGDDLQALFDGLEYIAGQEEAVREALSVIEGEMEARRPVTYVNAGASPPRDALFDQMLFGIFFAAGQARERARGRVTDALTVARNFQPDTARLFEGLPAELKGTATSFEEWSRAIESGDLDDRLGKIHVFLESQAALDLARPQKTTAKTMAEESAPLLGADLSATGHGRAPGADKAADLTALTKKWTEYARQFYGDGSSDPNQQKKDKDQLAQLVAAGLAGIAPNIADKTLDSVAQQIAGKLIAAVPELADSVATSDESDEAWIEEIVQTVADKLLADGESGIDTAVVTDDLRQCLKEVLSTASTRLDALARCTLETRPTTWIDEATSSAFEQFEAAGSSEDEALGQAIAYGNCLRVASWSGGATKDEALEQCKGFLGIAPPAEQTAAPTAPPTAAPTQADPCADALPEPDR